MNGEAAWVVAALVEFLAEETSRDLDHFRSSSRFALEAVALVWIWILLQSVIVERPKRSMAVAQRARGKAADPLAGRRHLLPLESSRALSHVC